MLLFTRFQLGPAHCNCGNDQYDVISSMLGIYLWEYIGPTLLHLCAID